MKKNTSFLREKPEYEDYSDNVVVLTEDEEKELGLYNPPTKRCCGSSEGGCNGCSNSNSCGKGCSSKESSNEKGCTGCQGGCCSK